MLENGMDPSAAGRHEIFFAGRLPCPNCFLSAINDIGRLKFECDWSQQQIDLYKQYVYKPDFECHWILVDAEEWQSEGNVLLWNITTEYPTTNNGIAPQFILAISTFISCPHSREQEAMG